MKQSVLTKIRRNKFGNCKTSCLSRHLHDSKFEANYCNRLYAMRQKGEIFDFKIQVPYALDVNGQTICTHIVDFFVERVVVVDNFKAKKNGLKNEAIGDGLSQLHFFEIHEVKGFATDVWRIKLKLFKACYPDIKYIVVRKAKRSDPWTMPRPSKITHQK